MCRSSWEERIPWVALADTDLEGVAYWLQEPPAGTALPWRQPPLHCRGSSTGSSGSASLKHIQVLELPPGADLWWCHYDISRLMLCRNHLQWINTFALWTPRSTTKASGGDMTTWKWSRSCWTTWVWISRNYPSLFFTTNLFFKGSEYCYPLQTLFETINIFSSKRSVAKIKTGMNGKNWSTQVVFQKCLHWMPFLTQHCILSRLGTGAGRLKDPQWVKHIAPTGNQTLVSFAPDIQATNCAIQALIKKFHLCVP